MTKERKGIAYIRRGIACILLAAAVFFMDHTPVRAGGCEVANFTTQMTFDFCTGAMCMDIQVAASGLHGNDMFHFDFGDGSSYDTLVVQDLDNFGGTLTGVCHTYQQPGNYIVTVSIVPSHTTCVIQKEITYGYFPTASDVTCGGNGTDGAIDYTIGGGTPPFTYQWSSGATTQDLTGLTPGTYYVTITDGNSCTALDTVAVQDFTFNLDLSNANCSDGTADVLVVRDTNVTWPPVTLYLEDFNRPNGTQFGCEPDWWGIWPPTSSSYFFWVNAAKEYQSTGSGTYEWFSRCIDLTGCTDVQFSIKARPNGGIDATGDYFRVFYKLDGGPETPIVQLGGIGTFPNGTASMSTFTGAIPTGGCVEIVIRISHSSSSESYFFDDILVTCNSGTVTVYEENFSSYVLYDHIGRGGCWRIGGDNHWTLFSVQGGMLTFDDLNDKECYFETGCIDLSGCSGYPVLSIDLSSNAGINADGDEYIDVYYNYNNGADVFLYRKVDQDLTIFPIMSTFTDTLPVGPGGCVTVKLKVKSGFSEEYKIDNVRVECVPDNNQTYTYLWCNGQTTSSVTGLPPGSCLVTVTDKNGCAVVDSVVCAGCVLNVVPSVSDALCSGGSDGSITVTPSGGTAPYTYTWNNGMTGQTVTGLTSGNYTVTVNDNSGTCSRVLTLTVGAPPPVTVAISDAPANCNGGNDGSATATPSGGTPGYTYTWSNGQSGQTATGLTAGTYTVTVTDANGCTSANSVTVTEPLALTTATDKTDALCSGGGDGTATVTPSDGTPGYTYTWSGGQTDSTATGLTAGTYTVTVTDANGCTAINSVTVAEPPALTLNVTPTDALCNGGATGSGNLTPSGGTPGYTYNWSDGSTNEDPAGLTAGTYTVTVTDANGCTSTSSVTIGEPSPVAPNTSATPSTCGNPDGSGTAAPSGGTPGYTYLWDAGAGNQTTATATGLPAGSYNVTITDANGCTSAGSVNISDLSGPTATSSSTPVNCNSGGNGTGTVTPSGGTPGYTYTWSGGQTDSTATGLTAGTYTVTVTDANGCTSTSSVTVAEPPALTLNVTPTDALCNGGATGSGDLTPSGGTPGYTYNWSDGSTNEDPAGLTAGTYTVTVTDANGCTSTSSVTIGEPSPVAPNTSATPSTCGNANGSGTAAPTGGTPGYTYLWDAGAGNQTTATATGLTAGTYTVTVTDANGCTSASSVNISDLSGPTATSSSTPVNCNGGNNGSGTVTPSGGTPGYTYTWSGGQTDSTATGLTAGTYTVTVTDANGCTSTSSVTIGEPSPVAPNTSATPSTCGNANGSGTAAPTGGTPGYTYLWDAGAGNQTTATATGLTAGTYTVTVTDANGCTSTGSVTFSDPGGPTTAISSAPLSCYGDNNGSATVLPSGGTPGYTYTWSDGSTSLTASGLTAGTYTVTVTDANGCTSISSATITQPPQVIADAGNDTTICDNTIVVLGGDTVGLGGTPGYTYLWSPSGATTANPTITASPNGTYTVTVTDANGCQATDYIVIASSPYPVPDFTAGFLPACEGVKTTVTNLSINGTSYYWDFGDGTTSDQPNPVHFYNYGQPIRITLAVSNGGCSDTMSVTDTILNFRDYINPKVPNVFTPNNDGYNDVFRIETFGDLRECTKFKIFNRWGLLLYNPDVGELGWDGRTVAGVGVPEGTYFYLITILDEYEFAGTLSLLRDIGK